MKHIGTASYLVVLVASAALSLSTAFSQPPPEKKKKTCNTQQRDWEQFFVENVTESANHADVLQSLFCLRQDYFLDHLIDTKLVAKEDAMDQAEAIIGGWQKYANARTKEWNQFWDDNRHEYPLSEWKRKFDQDQDTWLRSAKERFPQCSKNLAFATSGWKQFIEKEPLTVADALQRLSPDNREEGFGIHNIQTQVSDVPGRAYYLPHGTVDFRHQGISWKRPPKLLLQTLSAKHYESKILVFYSASGTGKTVELAGSSVSRDAHLTIILTPRDNAADRVDKDHVVTEVPGEHSLRQLDDALTILRNEILEVARENQAAFATLLNAANHEQIPLKLVIALDEASQCPDLVRSIIREPTKAGDTVKDAFKKEFTSLKNPSISVQFSVAGTGVVSPAPSTGSLPSNFVVIEPTGADNVLLRNLLLRNVPDLLVPGSGGHRKQLSACIDENLPVVAVLMENGRMASIACAVLKEHPPEIPVVESTLVASIAIKFMKSNALERLVESQDRRHRVAAAAIAVHLFQEGLLQAQSFPSSPKEYENLVQAMDFALPLAQSFKGPANDDIKRIVSRFGLLEPSKEQTWEPGAKIETPFLMRPSQQLLALFMLDVGLDGMLESTPYGFETLTTHMVKCAVAASLTIAEAKRPNLQEVLSQIGFQIDEKSTSQDIRNTWNGLKDYKAIGSKYTSSEERTVFYHTRQLQAELDVAKTSTGKEVLVIDKLLLGALKGMEADPSSYSSPVAFINYGNSPFADGFITFHVRNEQNNQVKKFTVMNQSKDYHNGSSLKAKKLNDHAQLGKHKLLDPLFGSDRLLCVSSSRDVVVSKQTCSTKRDFIPFCADQSCLLTGLLQKLARQRNKHDRIKAFACGCDKEGNVVEESVWLECRD